MAGAVKAYSLKNKKVWVAGHRGMVGSALVRRLQLENCEILTVDRETVDLRDQAAVSSWMEDRRPQAIFIAAATSGGILANDSRPAEFLYDNLAMVSNIVTAAHASDAEKLMFMGTACIYPKFTEQPMRESALLEGPLEPTNEWYAVAKIAGIKLCQAYRRQYGRDYISVVPANLYGPGDNFDPDSSHVIPAMVRKVHAAIENGGPVEVWGTGAPRREFLFVDDAADAMILLMQCYSDEDVINVAGGEDLSIRELAELVAQVMGYQGEFSYDSSRPDGMPLKRLDASKISALGWRPQTPMGEGLEMVCRWYVENVGG